MNLSAVPSGQEVAAELYELLERLYPIGRSLTGDGVRDTLAVLRDEAGVELETTEIPTSTPVYDWTVPQEWRLRDAYVATLEGRRVVDLAASNLHVVGYSTPVRERMTRKALDGHLHSLPGMPDLVPYRTSYYGDTWGFCVSHHVREELTDHEYDVVIDSEHFDGALTLGEAQVRGETADEVLVSCNTCHPSLANDGVSGIVLSALLARELAKATPRLSYRFLFSPGTIGPLAWLSRNEGKLDRTAYGLVISCVGDSGPVTYKRSRSGRSGTDRVASAVLPHLGLPYRLAPFVPWGGDERQFCSPGFDLPIGALSRTPHGEYPEYHTSADDLKLVTREALAESWDVTSALLRAFEANGVYKSTNPMGEPQLGRRGLYRQLSTGLPTDGQQLERARLWVLNLADGEHDLAAIVERSELPWSVVAEAAAELERVDLLRRAA